MSREYVLQPFRPPIQAQIDFARELNEQQYAAVTAPPGPSLVIAGAGSGKTRTLTYRVAYLLEQGVPADRILLLTFTNKAATEMMRRVADLLGQELTALWGGTFHSIGNRILRLHAGQLGYQRDFTILDREDARHLVTDCLAEAESHVKGDGFPRADVLGNIFSLATNTQLTVDEILKGHYEYFSQFGAEISLIRQRYTERKRAANAMDFDDLLALWFRLLQEAEDAREHYQRRFQFILVDEYQDTNKLQSDLIDILAVRHKNVMVVGDDAQSIYAWRGANYQNILKFPERYPGATTYKIETNYRSTPEILEVANAAIAGNQSQFAKALAPARKPGQKPTLVACNDSAEQAAFIAQRVLKLWDEGGDLNKMAVLYRSHYHALDLQLELTRRHIPFSITSGIRFFEQAHIKDMAAYLKLVSNPRDELSFKRLVQLLPGVGAKGAHRLWRQFSAQHEAQQAEAKVPKSDPEPQNPVANAVESGITLHASRSAHHQAGNTEHETRGTHHASRFPPPPVATALQLCASAVSSKTALPWAQFTATIAQLEAPAIRNDASKMIRLVIEAGYEDYLKANYPNFRSRLEDLQQLAAFALQFDGVEDFLTQLALATNVEAEYQPTTGDDDRLRLSTIHQAKGLEFDVVFVIMLCDGLFPSKHSLETVQGEEEERRLMYVAVTRARNELYLSYPRVRATSEGGYSTQQPSRFLGEIPPQLIDEQNLKSYH